MITVIDRLLRGDESVVAKFKAAHAFWERFFKDHQNDDVAQLAKALGDSQVRYEWAFSPEGDRSFAKESMPLTCFGFLYDEVDGWAKNLNLALKVAKALEQSYVSIEIKSYTLEAVRLYHLDQRDEELRKVVERHFQ